jgi:hypothetical protein
LLFFPSGAEPLWGGALVSWCLGGEKKKKLPQKAQNLQLSNYRRPLFRKVYIDLDGLVIYGWTLTQ